MTATETKIRRDTETNLNAATPAEGELGYDKTNKRIVIGDGATQGGIKIPSAKDAQNQTFTSVDAGGTADAITVDLFPAPAGYAAYQRFTFKAASTNATPTPTLNVNGIGAKTIKKKTASGVAPLAAGDIRNGGIYSVVYDGTFMQLEGVASPEVPASGMTEIASASPRGVATSDALAIPQDYAMLLLTWSDISCDANTRKHVIRFGTDGAFFQGTNAQLKVTGTTVTGNSAHPSLDQTFSPEVSAAASQAVSGSLLIIGYQAHAPKMFIYKSISGGGLENLSIGTITGMNGALNSIRNMWDGGGNFDGGSWTLYGIR